MNHAEPNSEYFQNVRYAVDLSHRSMRTSSVSHAAGVTAAATNCLQ